MEQPFNLSPEQVTDKKTVAIHEAAHAVMTYLLHDKIDYEPSGVTAEAGPNTDGDTSVLGYVSFKRKRDAAMPWERDISTTIRVKSNDFLVKVAGYVAEKIAFETPVDYERLEDENIHDPLEEMGFVFSDFDEVDPRIESGLREAEILLRENWEAVEFLASELLEQEHISDYQLDGIMKPYLKTVNNVSFAISTEQATAHLGYVKEHCKDIRRSFRNAVQVRTGEFLRQILNNDIYSDSDKVKSARNWLAAVDSALDE